MTNLINKSIIVLLSTSALLNASNLKTMVNDTLDNNSEIQSINSNNDSSKENIKKYKGKYLPKIDFKAVGEIRKTDNKPDGASEINTDQTGNNLKLDLEQLIYDGGQTGSKIDSEEYKVKARKFSNAVKIDKIVLDAVKSYIDVAKYTQRENLSKNNIQTHKNYLKTAQEQEALTDNSLDRHEVEAKLYLAKKENLDDIDNLETSKFEYKRLSSDNVTGDVCMPNINKALIPSKLQVILDDAMSNNLDIKSEMANVEKLHEDVNQQSSKYYPSIKLKLSAQRDSDLILNNSTQNILSGKLELKYNIYNGGIDQSSKTKYKIQLKEGRDDLRTKEDSVVEKISSNFATYNNSTAKLVELSKYVKTNEKILSMYKELKEAGSKTFTDVLIAESNLYSSRLLKIDEEAKQIKAYYEILSATNQLRNEINNQVNTTCSNK